MASTSRRLRAWDGEIDTLPAEVLSYDIREIPRSTLNKIANRLHAETISTGNWESLSERLGFLQNSVLDHLMQQARVQNTYPGLLMLQEWARRAGSTAHVLLHALREIGREDVIRVLVEKLFDLHTMQLLVSIQDGSGPPKFQRVPTQKSAPLHASLENMLTKPPYWYDIIGPSHDICWSTPSGDLQGAQLSLRMRIEPSQKSMGDIYGNTSEMYQALPLPPNHLNIPVDQPLGAEGGVENGAVSGAAEGHAVCKQNNLSDINKLFFRQNMNLSQSPDRSFQMQQPPLVCRPQPCEPEPAEIMLDIMEPMTDAFPAIPDAINNFPDFDTLMPSVSTDYDFGVLNAASSTPSNRLDTEFHPSSFTGVKQAVRNTMPEEHDETVMKGLAKGVCKNQDTVAKESGDVGMAEVADFQDIEKSPSTSSSFMHPDYITHDRLIEFCNNPASPQSLNNDCSLNSSTTHIMPHQSVGKHSLPCQNSEAQQSMPTKCKQMHTADDYVPLAFIEQQSQNFHRNASVPALCEAEHTQTEHHAYGNSAASEGMDFTTEDQMVPAKNSSPQHISCVSSSSAFINTNDSKPPPCTYSMYRPGVTNEDRNLVNFHPRPIPHTVSLDHGYLDLRGNHQRACEEQCSNIPSTCPAAIHHCMSVDSYMNKHSVSEDAKNAGCDHLGDSSARNQSASDNNQLLLSRSRRPLPGNGDFFQPRDRRPLTQEHDMLLDEPEPEYSYIDPVPVPMVRGCTRSAFRGATAAACASVSQPNQGPSQHRSPDLFGEKRPSESVARDRESQIGHRTSVFTSDLEKVPGWNPHVTDANVDHEMSRYINEDGNFIVWHYDVGAKFVISVSHLRSIRHYAVYEAKREGQIYYHIFPKGARFCSLVDLVQYCQVHGVTEPTKTFRTPNGQVQPLRSSGRFCHVRLKAPIPARKN